MVFTPGFQSLSFYECSTSTFSAARSPDWDLDTQTQGTGYLFALTEHSNKPSIEVWLKFQERLMLAAVSTSFMRLAAAS